MLAIIVAYVGVWVVADDEIAPDLEPVAAGAVLQVGPAVTFVPQDGWYLDATDSSQSDSTSSVILVGQGAQFAVNVSPWQSTLSEEVDRQKALYEAYGDARLIGDDAVFSTAGGLSGTTFTFLTKENQGRIWISVDENADRAVVVTGRTLNSSFGQALPGFQAMIESVRTGQS